LSKTNRRARRLFIAAGILFAALEGNFLYDYAYRAERRLDVDLQLLLLCLVWLALRRGREVAAGVLLAVAILIKPTPAILLLYLAARRSWRALAAGGAALALGVAASLVVLPPQLWRTWLLEVRPSLGYGLQPVHLFSPACPSNQSLNAMVSRFFLAPRGPRHAAALTSRAAAGLGGRTDLDSNPRRGRAVAAASRPGRDLGAGSRRKQLCV